MKFFTLFVCFVFASSTNCDKREVLSDFQEDSHSPALASYQSIIPLITKDDLLSLVIRMVSENPEVKKKFDEINGKEKISAKEESEFYYLFETTFNDANKSYQFELSEISRRQPKQLKDKLREKMDTVGHGFKNFFTFNWGKIVKNPVTIGSSPYRGAAGQMIEMWINNLIGHLFTLALS